MRDGRASRLRPSRDQVAVSAEQAQAGAGQLQRAAESL